GRCPLAWARSPHGKYPAEPARRRRVRDMPEFRCVSSLAHLDRKSNVVAARGVGAARTVLEPHGPGDAVKSERACDHAPAGPGLDQLRDFHARDLVTEFREALDQAIAAEAGGRHAIGRARAEREPV